MMKKALDHRLLELLLAVLLVSFGCGSPEPAEDEGDSAGGGPVQASRGETLFRDDFSSPASGWQREDEDYQTTGYADGTYLVQLKDTNLITRVPYPGEDLEDGEVEVDATLEEGSDGTCGLYARYTSDRFLRCVINDQGEAALQAVRYEDYTVPAPTFEPSEAIKKGTNRIALSFVGKDVTCRINGVEIKKIADPDPEAGSLGLVVTNNQKALEVRFDNFVLSRP